MAVPYNAREIEESWRRRWVDTGLHSPALDAIAPEALFYNLVEFPYPSAEGLHVGHVFKYSGADAYGRYQRMQGQTLLVTAAVDAEVGFRDCPAFW